MNTRINSVKTVFLDFDGDLRVKFLVRNYVQTKDGLEENHAEKAIKILNQA